MVRSCRALFRAGEAAAARHLGVSADAIILSSSVVMLHTCPCAHYRPLDSRWKVARAGEIWAWDLSESLGWARDPAQRGCWLKYRSRSDAESGGWRWPVLVHRAEQDHSSHGGPILAALPGCPDAGVVSLRTTALGGTLTLDESGEINNLSDTVTLWSLAAQSERGSA